MSAVKYACAIKISADVVRYLCHQLPAANKNTLSFTGIYNQTVR